MSFREVVSKYDKTHKTPCSMYEQFKQPTMSSVTPRSKILKRSLMNMARLRLRMRTSSTLEVFIWLLKNLVSEFGSLMSMRAKPSSKA